MQFKQAVISTQASGSMGRHTVMAITAIQMELPIKAIGLQIGSMETVQKPGQTAHSIKDLTSQGKNMDKTAFLSGQTILNMKDSSETIILKVQGPTLGQMDALLQVSGEKIRCMVKEFSLGLIAEKCIAGNTETTRSMALVR